MHTCSIRTLIHNTVRRTATTGFEFGACGVVRPSRHWRASSLVHVGLSARRVIGIRKSRENVIGHHALEAESGDDDTVSYHCVPRNECSTAYMTCRCSTILNSFICSIDCPRLRVKFDRFEPRQCRGGVALSTGTATTWFECEA